MEKSLIHFSDVKPKRFKVYENCYIGLEEKIKKSIVKKLFEIYPRKSLTSLSKFLKTDRHVLSPNSNKSIPLSLLKRISQILISHGHEEFSLEIIEKNIKSIKGQGRGIKIFRPNFPFNFNTSSGVRLVSRIFHDGGIASNRKPFYRNNREELINEFCEDVKSIFGEIELKIKHDARGMVVFLPRLIGDILELVGCPVGRKVLLNPSPPKWIEKLDKKLIKEYIRVAMDDDGSVGDHHIVIGSSVDITALARKSFVKMLLKLPEMERIRTLKNIDKLKPEKFIPKILLFNKKLIEKFNIKTSQPVIERYYTDKQNKNLRVYWKFYISSKHNLEKFQKIIGFKIQDKFQKLEMNL